jgi:hypothetical protein
VSGVGEAWQAALAAEHQAVFGYSILGPHLSGDQLTLAHSCAAGHESLRDAAAAALAAAGYRPVAAQPDYPGLYPVPDAAAARRLAIGLEEHAVAAWRYLYLRAASAPTNAANRKLRGSAQAALVANAVRATQWRAITDPAHATEPFPGT